MTDQVNLESQVNALGERVKDHEKNEKMFVELLTNLASYYEHLDVCPKRTDKTQECKCGLDKIKSLVGTYIS